MEDEQLNPADYPSRWWIMRENWHSRWWAIEHWLITHLFTLHFCPSCGGYFREACMTLPDKCEACYARDYGVR